MDEAIEAPQGSEQTPSQIFLEKLGPEDGKNIDTIKTLMLNSLTSDGLEGFIYAVGGTVKHDNPQERKDIDLLVGVNKDPGDLSNLADIGK